MERENIEEALETLQNGNISDFRVWLKKANKLDILNAIEIYSSRYGKRHNFINEMIRYLEMKT